ncbi:MAG: N-acetyltransferase [Balneolaceae bacterium]|nr:N-acetyltransferase [Balneolaceae bacterium]
MVIRKEEPKDHGAVRALNTAAFESTSEAALVERLRRETEPTISLVAEEDGEIVGHIFFSPVSIDGHPELKAMGLGPMAVLPGRQRSGIGAGLVKEGLQKCRELQACAVVVLGHPAYYPRFGFVPAHHFGLSCTWEVPPEAFMALQLTAGCLEQVSGTVRYHPAFADA